MQCLRDWFISALVVFGLVVLFGWTGERDYQDAVALAGVEPGDYRLALAEK